MASVKIRLSDSHDLPLVCAYCGEEASHEELKKYSKYPGWVGVFIVISIPIWLLLRYALRSTALLNMPVCDRHTNCGNWVPKIWVIGLSLTFLGSIGGGLLDQYDRNLSMNITMGSSVLIVVTIIAAICAADSQISAEVITDRTVTLDGVSKEFAAACRSEPVQLVAVGGKARTSGGGMELTTAKYMKR